MKGTKCIQCKKGEYQETGIFDPWDGLLHCTHCGHEVRINESGRPIKESKDGDQEGE